MLALVAIGLCVQFWSRKFPTGSPPPVLDLATLTMATVAIAFAWCTEAWLISPQALFGVMPARLRPRPSSAMAAIRRTSQSVGSPHKPAVEAREVGGHLLAVGAIGEEARDIEGAPIPFLGILVHPRMVISRCKITSNSTRAEPGVCRTGRLDITGRIREAELFVAWAWV